MSHSLVELRNVVLPVSILKKIVASDILSECSNQNAARTEQGTPDLEHFLHFLQNSEIMCVTDVFIPAL